MRVLGLDVGERRIGVALSDALGLTAQPLTTIVRQGRRADLKDIRALVARHDAQAVVVGLPLTMQGARGVQAMRVEAFVASLRGTLPVPVQCLDERLTTVQGERALLEADTSRRKRKQLIDQVAAQLILQQYLDAQRHAR